MNRLTAFKLRPEPRVQEKLKGLGSAPIKNMTSLAQLLRRNEILIEHLRVFNPELGEIDDRIAGEVETRIKYEGYIERQERQVEKLKRMEDMRLPENIDYQSIYGLSREVKEKLSKVGPVSLGQASRISGITPAALMAVQVHLKRMATHASEASPSRPGPLREAQTDELV
jgi:tRNA uridine 5-carboxymethylaminomethyl modification enzyme